MDRRYGYKGLSTFCRVGFRRVFSARWEGLWYGLVDLDVGLAVGIVDPIIYLSTYLFGLYYEDRGSLVIDGNTR